MLCCVFVCWHPANEERVIRFLRPGKHIVQLYGVCVDAVDGRRRLVMELCSGGDLKKFMQTLADDKVRYA
jgi:hypothetical protein